MLITYDGFPRLDEAFPICDMQEIYLQVDKNKGLVLSITGCATAIRKD
jgi:hypothetical protein